MAYSRWGSSWASGSWGTAWGTTGTPPPPTVIELDDLTLAPYELGYLTFIESTVVTPADLVYGPPVVEPIPKILVWIEQKTYKDLVVFTEEGQSHDDLIFINRLAWAGALSAGDQVKITEADGSPLVEGRATENGYVDLKAVEDMWAYGITIDRLDNGKVYLMRGVPR